MSVAWNPEMLHTSPVSEPSPKYIPRKPKRGRETAWDMFRSMAVLGVLVIFILAVTWRPDKAGDEIRPVDAVAIAQGEQAMAEFTLMVPALPAGWTATSARLEPAPNDGSKKWWHIGYVTKSGNYVAIEQSDTALTDQFTKQFVIAPRPIDTIVSGPVQWKVYRAKESTAFTTQLLDSLLIVICDEESDSAEILPAIEAAIGEL